MSLEQGGLRIAIESIAAISVRQINDSYNQVALSFGGLGVDVDVPNAYIRYIRVL